jgi:hypothetical protein
MNAVFGHLRRRASWIGSVAAHAVLLALLYYYGAWQPALRAQAREIDAGSAMSGHAQMRSRVADMERIKELMQQSMGKADATPAPQDGPRFDATSAPQQPQELVAQAERLGREIDELARQARKAEEKRLLGKDAPDDTAILEPMAADRDRRPEAVADAAQAAPRQGSTEKPATQQASTQQPSAQQMPAQQPSTQQMSKEQPATQPMSKEQPATQPQQPPTRQTSAQQPSTQQASAQQPSGKQGSTPSGNGNAATGSEGSAAAAGERIAQLESRARSRLSERQRQVDGKEHGVPVSVSGGIGEFLNRDVAQVRNRSGGYRGNGVEIFGEGAGFIPSVAAGPLVPGRGRVIGEGGDFTNRLYVNSWYLIGPFEGKHGLGLFNNFSHPPEQAVILDAAYRGKDGRFLKWQYVTAQTYPLVPPDAVEDGVYYGYTELMFDEDREMVAWIGGDDDARVWINDRLAWKGGNSNKAWFWEEIYATRNNYVGQYNLTEGKVKVRFRKGRNKVFFKVSNGPSRMYFSLVLTQP